MKADDITKKRKETVRISFEVYVYYFHHDKTLRPFLPFHRYAIYITGVSRYKDFIQCLPVHISKMILGYMDQHSLYNCLCVNQFWRQLSESVQREYFVYQNLREEVMLMQVSARNVSHKLCSRFCLFCIHGCILCCVVLYTWLDNEVREDTCNSYIQDYITGTGAIVWIPEWQRNNPEWRVKFNV